MSLTITTLLTMLTTLTMLTALPMLTGKKRRVIRMKGIPVASMEHDVSDAVQL